MAPHPSSTTIFESLAESAAKGFQFLSTDVQLAHTLLDRAAASHDEETRARNLHNVEKAYTTICHLMPKLRLDAQQTHELNAGLQALRERLASFSPRSG